MLICICMICIMCAACQYACAIGAHVKLREQFLEVNSLLPPTHESQGLNPGPQCLPC